MSVAPVPLPPFFTPGVSRGQAKLHGPGTLTTTHIRETSSVLGTCKPQHQYVRWSCCPLPYTELGRLGLGQEHGGGAPSPLVQVSSQKGGPSFAPTARGAASCFL